MSYSTSLDWKGRVLVVRKHSGSGLVDIWQIHEPTKFTISTTDTLTGIFNGNSVGPDDAIKILEMVFQHSETTIFARV